MMRQQEVATMGMVEATGEIEGVAMVVVTVAEVAEGEVEEGGSSNAVNSVL